MGHRADYHLSFLTPEGLPHYGVEEKRVVGEMNDNISCQPFSFEYYRTWVLWESKWPQRDEELRAFSKKHPDILFFFKVDFADIEEWFHLYVLDGKIQKCLATITYPPFNPDLLA